MSAVSLKPSAILEATFSATWFGLQQKVKVTVLREPWHFSWKQQETCLKRCENYIACLQTGTRYQADATHEWSQQARQTPAPLFSRRAGSSLCLGNGFLKSKMLTALYVESTFCSLPPSSTRPKAAASFALASIWKRNWVCCPVCIWTHSLPSLHQKQVIF